LVIAFVLITRRLPDPPRIPYTTLFRSEGVADVLLVAENVLLPVHVIRHIAVRLRPLSRRTDHVGDFVPLRDLVILFVLRHAGCRSEEHTSELQSRSDLVCRLLLEKKKK